MKVVSTCTISVPLSIPEPLMPQIRKEINMAIVGQENVNQPDDRGNLVAIPFPEEKLKALKEAHHTVRMSHRARVIFDITDTGEWVNFRIEV